VIKPRTSDTGYGGVNPRIFAMINAAVQNANTPSQPNKKSTIETLPPLRRQMIPMSMRTKKTLAAKPHIIDDNNPDHIFSSNFIV
jgi:hypothetical protein